MIPANELVWTFDPPLADTLTKLYVRMLESVMEFTKSIVIDKSIAQLFVNPIDKSPPEKDADVKLPKLSAANVPTLFSFTLGTGPVKLLAFKLVLLTPNTISSVTLIVTGVDGEPGLETDTISNPNVFGIVIPAMLCD